MPVFNFIYSYLILYYRNKTKTKTQPNEPHKLIWVRIISEPGTSKLAVN